MTNKERKTKPQERPKTLPHLVKPIILARFEDSKKKETERSTEKDVEKRRLGRRSHTPKGTPLESYNILLYSPRGSNAPENGTDEHGDSQEGRLVLSKEENEGHDDEV